MPAPVAYVVAASVAAVATSFAFYHYVYEPHIAPRLERMAEDFLARRRAARRELTSPVEASAGPDDNIPLNETRQARSRPPRLPRSRSSSTSSTAPLIPPPAGRPGPSVTDASGPRVSTPGFQGDQEHDVNAHHHHHHHGQMQSLIATARDLSASEDTNAGLRRRAAVGINVVSEPGDATAPQPFSLEGSARLSPQEVNEWRNRVSQHALRRRTVRSPLSSGHVEARPPSRQLPPVSHVLDEPNHSLPQTPIYPTHIIADSSVPSTPSSTTSAARRLDTPPPQVSPLRSANRDSIISDISTTTNNTGANVVGDTHTGALDLQPNPASSANNALSPTATEDSTMIPTAPPSLASQPHPLSVLSVQSNLDKRPLPTSPTTPSSPPYLMSPSAQHPHHVHYPAPANITSSSVNAAANTNVPGALPASPIPSLSQTYPISLDQEHGIELVSNPSSSEFEFDPISSPDVGSESPFVPLSPAAALNLGFSSPIPVTGAAASTTRDDTTGNDAGDEATMPGSAATIRQGILDEAMHARTSANRVSTPQSPSSPSMFYSFSEYSLPAASEPRTQPSILSFPNVLDASRAAEVNQQASTSPGVLSPTLSELDFVSDLDGSDGGHSSRFSFNDELGSESSWASARF